MGGRDGSVTRWKRKKRGEEADEGSPGRPPEKGYQIWRAETTRRKTPSRRVPVLARAVVRSREHVSTRLGSGSYKSISYRTVFISPGSYMSTITRSDHIHGYSRKKNLPMDTSSPATVPPFFRTIKTCKHSSYHV